MTLTTPVKIDFVASHVASSSPEKDNLVISLEKHSLKMIDGLSFLSIKNRNNIYVIPSSRNYVDGIQFKNVVTDSGYSSYLLQLEDDDLDMIFFKVWK
jgi:hypothetical protein